MFLIYSHHFQYFHRRLKIIQISNFFSTRLVFNVSFLNFFIFLIESALIFFKIKIQKNKKMKKMKKNLDKGTKMKIKKIRD